MRCKLRDGDIVIYNGKVWTWRGKKLVHPVPVKLLEETYMKRYARHVREALNRAKS